MKIAYVDTSCVTAVALHQRGFESVERLLGSFGTVYSSNLLEAELRATLKRERLSRDPAPLLAKITWVYADRPLTHEFQRVLEAGYVRGADLWHLACALYLAENPANLVLVTLDVRQADVGRRLGFRIR